MMATRGGKAKQRKAATQDVQACRSDNGTDTLARAKARPAPHPDLRAGVFGRTEYVTATLTVLDYRAPKSTGRYLPDAPGHAPRPLPDLRQLTREVSDRLPQWHHLDQPDGLAADEVRSALGA